MSHRYRQKPPSTRMYRHFAIVTVATTGLLALFAEGEKAEAVARHTDRPLHAEAEPPKSEPKRDPPPAVQQPGGVWGSDGGASGTMSASGSGSSAWWAEFSTRGQSSDYLAQMSEEERRALEAAIAANTGGSLAANRSEIARLEAASHHRSGSVPDP